MFRVRRSKDTPFIDEGFLPRGRIEPFQRHSTRHDQRTSTRRMTVPPAPVRRSNRPGSPRRGSGTGSEDLDPEVGLLDDENKAVVVDGDTGGSTQFLRAGAGFAPHCREATVGAEALDTVVGVVGDEDGTVVSDRDAFGTDRVGAELSLVVTAPSPLAEKVAVGA